jgi:hypothetical protein
MMSLAELVAQSGIAHREAAGGGMFWLSIDASAMRIEFAAFEDGDRVRLLFRFGEQPVDTSADLLTYYLQLNSDMSLFRLYLAENNRLYLSGSYTRAGLEIAEFEWLVREFAQYCDYLYPNLVVELAPG